MPKNLEVVVIDPDVNSRADTNRALVMSRFTVTGEAGYGIDAVSMAKDKNPDVIVLAMEEPVARARPHLPEEHRSPVGQRDAERCQVKTELIDYLNNGERWQGGKVRLVGLVLPRLFIPSANMLRFRRVAKREMAADLPPA